MADDLIPQWVRQELDAMVRDGLIEALPGGEYRLTAAGRAYNAVRGLCDPHQTEGKQS